MAQTGKVPREANVGCTWRAVTRGVVVDKDEAGSTLRERRLHQVPVTCLKHIAHGTWEHTFIDQETCITKAQNLEMLMGKLRHFLNEASGKP